MFEYMNHWEVTEGMTFDEIRKSVREFAGLDEFDQLAVKATIKCYGWNLAKAICEVKKWNHIVTYYDRYDWDWPEKFGEWLADAGCLWESQDISEWKGKDYEDYAKAMIFNGNFHDIAVDDYVVILD